MDRVTTRPRRVSGTDDGLRAARRLLGRQRAPADTLTWYINPDAGGQAKVAENCSTDDYTIEVQVLPQNASEQRIQLSRRLAAEDPEIDIMSIDPPYTAEFSNAGFLAAIPARPAGQAEAAVLQGRGRTPPPGTASWSSRRSGPTPRCSGTASPSSQKAGST